MVLINGLQDIHHPPELSAKLCVHVFLERGFIAFIRFSERSLTPERKEPLLWDLNLGLPVGKAIVDIHWAPTTHQAPLSTLRALLHLSLQIL